ncbi:MAG: hypothetical protein ACE5EF_12745, partial [Dehalococcoidia bacterium]
MPVIAPTLGLLLILGGCGSSEPPAAEPPSTDQVPATRESGPQGIGVTTPADTPAAPARGFLLGTLPVPADGQTFEEAYRQASRYAGFAPVWGRPTPPFELADDLGGDWGEVVEEYIRGNGMIPLVQMSFIGAGLSLAAPPGMAGATLSDPDWREAYRRAALDVVRASRPLYISIGNEVNRWYEKYGSAEDSPNGFQHFVSLYEEIYEAIKAISPETRVFCIFSREIVSENREAALEVLSLFDPAKLDLLVFTSYPYAVRGINRPSDIPDDYYAGALAYLPGRPLGFSELGWPSLDAFGGEQGQADLLAAVAGRLTAGQGIDLELLGWAWLHDLDENDRIESTCGPQVG